MRKSVQKAVIKFRDKCNYDNGKYLKVEIDKKEVVLWYNTNAIVILSWNELKFDTCNFENTYQKELFNWILNTFWLWRLFTKKNILHFEDSNWYIQVFYDWMTLKTTN